jgi:putative ubiquitin-RnfH superfamily antitoxin RatB of RatAB toxin-antitoxin module
MAKTTQGSFRVPGGFKIQNPYPVDDRITVDNDSDLLSNSILPDIYAGIIVYSNQSKKHYTWTEGNRSISANWKQIGSQYSANDGVILDGTILKVDNTVVRTSGNQSVSGTKTIKTGLNFDNNIYQRIKKQNGTLTRVHGINSSDIEYIGSVDSSVAETKIGNQTSKLSFRTSNFDRLTIDNLGKVKIFKSLEVTEGLTAEFFAESSLRKLKENIFDYKSSGLKKVNNLKIVTFDKIDGAKNKIGIIADDTDKDFLTEDQKAVDLYKTLFVQAKAIQELNKEVEQLKEIVNKLVNNG